MNRLFQMSGSPEAGSLDLIQRLYNVLGIQILSMVLLP